jgi:hypothetical protein
MHLPDKAKRTLAALSLGIGLMLASRVVSIGGPDLSYGEIARQLLVTALHERPSFALLERIVATGPRLAGSPGAAAAVELARQIMQDLELEAVHLEPTRVPRWIRGAPAEAHLISPRMGRRPLSVAAIGGSIATPEAGISASVLEVFTFEQLRTLGEQAVDRIVFFNRAMDPGRLDTFSAYGAAADQRTQGAVEAARVGALAVLVRSLTLRLDDSPHTGMMRYAPDVPPIPAACVSTRGAERLSQALKIDPETRVSLRFHCRNLEPVLSHNVIGQITGTDRPEEIILLGGHLDCWDLSHGAHDDGAGCAQSIAALQLLKQLGLKPRRTIRAVLFMNEEFGGSGGKDYAASEMRRDEKHVAALESDRGGFLPIYLGIGLEEREFLEFQKEWEPLFKSVGVQEIRRGGGGVDIAPLGSQGTVLCGLIPDSQRYFDVHHSAKDVIETVHPRELELGTVAMALFAYLIAQEGM